jgi:hypothetical protein
MLCAGSLWGEDVRGSACFGDSGGPLTVKDDTRQHTIVGVVSWVAGCDEVRIIVPTLHCTQENNFTCSARRAGAWHYQKPVSEGHVFINKSIKYYFCLLIYLCVSLSENLVCATMSYSLLNCRMDCSPCLQKSLSRGSGLIWRCTEMMTVRRGLARCRAAESSANNYGDF